MQPDVLCPPLIPAVAKRIRIANRRRLLLIAAVLVLFGGCASPTPPVPPPFLPLAVQPPAEDSRPPGPYVGGPVRLECAPFARTLSGVDLRGAAADWWQQAAERYGRASQPAVGAVLTFRRTSRLPAGHAAVVSRVLSAREILVTQANWVPHRVTRDMPVVDVSPANDWSAVRVWWPPSGQLGSRHYPTWGFILPDRPRSRDGLEASLQDALRLASSD